MKKNFSKYFPELGLLLKDLEEGLIVVLKIPPSPSGSRTRFILSKNFKIIAEL